MDNKLQKYLQLEQELHGELVVAIYGKLKGTFKFQSIEIHQPSCEGDAGISGRLITKSGVEYEFMYHLAHPNNAYKEPRGLILHKVDKAPFYCDYGHPYQRKETSNES